MFTGFYMMRTLVVKGLKICDLLWDAPTHKPTKLFGPLITWGHVANQKTYVSISILSFLITMNEELC